MRLSKFALSALLLLGGGPAAAEDLQLLAQLPVPEDLARVKDLRWYDKGAVLVVGTPIGLHRLPLAPGQPAETLVPGGRGLDKLFFAGRLAYSPPIIAVAGEVFEMVWKDLQTGQLERDVAFEFILDMDLQDGHYAVLGVQRGGQNEIAPDAAIAWLGELKPGLPTLKTLLYATSGKGAVTIERCAVHEIGQIRFFPDGNLLVVPGGEAGAFLYDAAGGLRHTWELQPLGVDFLCNLDYNQGLTHKINPESRWAWLNRFTLVDEILPLPQGPGLVLRSVSEKGTRWQLKILQRDGPAINVSIPFESPSTMSHLRGDVLGDRIAFLRWEEGRPENPRQAEPTIFITTVPRLTPTSPPKESTP